MPEKYTVVAGDCLSTIAEDFGFADYRSIYEHPSNAGLRKRRPNPNLICPGDIISIPDKTGRFEARATEASHEFKVRSSKRFLRLRVLSPEGRILGDTDYRLEVDGEQRTGRTDGSGILREPISRRARLAVLEVSTVRWNLKIGHLNPIDDAPDDGTAGVQQRLANLGYDTGPIDGVFGPRTAAAVRAFQEDNAPLAVDGICGPETRAKLVEQHGS
jgi:hypothetical protein